MFKNLFKVKKVEKEVRTGLKIIKLDKVTKILFPDENISELTKDDKVVLTSLEDGKIIITKLVTGIPEEIAKKAFSYNITDNSVNSQVAADKLRDLFIIDDENFSLNAVVEVIQGFECLVLTKKTIEETVVLDENNTSEAVSSEETVEQSDTSYL